MFDRGRSMREHLDLIEERSIVLGEALVDRPHLCRYFVDIDFSDAWHALTPCLIRGQFTHFLGKRASVSSKREISKLSRSAIVLVNRAQDQEDVSRC